MSLTTASLATVLCLLLGVPLALVIARSAGALAATLRTLTALPLVLPPLVGGIALLSLFGRAGLLGGALALVGIRIPFTTVAVNSSTDGAPASSVAAATPAGPASSTSTRRTSRSMLSALPPICSAPN